MVVEIGEAFAALAALRASHCRLVGGFVAGDASVARDPVKVPFELRAV